VCCFHPRSIASLCVCFCNCMWVCSPVPPCPSSLFVCVRACMRSCACLVDTGALASFSQSASRFCILLVTLARSAPLFTEATEAIAGYIRDIPTKPPFLFRLQIARWVVAHHLGVRVIPPLGFGYRIQWQSHRLPKDTQSPRRSAAVPIDLAMCSGRRSLGFLLADSKVFLRPRSTQCRVELLRPFCLPVCCVVGVPPWVIASRKCLAVSIGGWESSLLQVTSVW
jgi:hypothetical protein